jgi:hypothetical protein
MKIQMDTKRLLVSFFAVASILVLVSTVAAAQVAQGTPTVYVNGVEVGTNDVIGVSEGDVLSLRVVFTSDVNASDIKVKAEIEGYKTDVDDVTSEFVVEDGMRYSKSLSLEIPQDLDDELSDNAELDIKIYNKDDETVLNSIKLNVQREVYNAEVMSISTTQSAEAGTLFPVDVVLKNKGYNDLEDLYVKVTIPALGVERTAYFGDLVALEDDDNDDDETDTVSGRIYVEIPDNAKSGVYTLEVEASNDDTTVTKTKQISVASGFSGSNIFATVTGKSVAVGEDAVYSILIVNPSSKLKVYNVVSDASGELFTEVSEGLVAVPAGTSKTITVTAKANEEGTYNFNVNVFAGDELVDTVALSANVEGKTIGSPVAVLTVVLAIVFIVLLIVLFVSLGKKPEKTEEFGESYY